MKITISYREGERQRAEAVAEIARHLLGKAKITRSAKHRPYLHIYIAAREPPATGGGKNQA